MLATLSPELRLMLAPARTYRQLAARRGEAGGWLGRFLLVGLVVGTSVALAATGRASLGLVGSCSLAWSVAPMAQVLALAAVARPTPAQPFGRLLELFLFSHAPWSLWLLLYSLSAALSFPQGSAGWSGVARYAIATALIPAAWTAWVVFCFFREVLALPPRRALLRTLGYQLALWGPALVCFGFAVQLWPRLALP